MVHILADHREVPSGIPALLDADKRCELEIGTLTMGDYVLDRHAVIERKTLQDLESSIVDGRLFAQASRLRRSPLRSAVLLEGTGPRTRLPRPAIQGALVTLTLIFDVPLLRTRSRRETATLLVAAAAQLAKPTSEAQGP